MEDYSFVSLFSSLEPNLTSLTSSNDESEPNLIKQATERITKQNFFHTGPAKQLQ
jgi:hypothetical protein